MRSPESFLFHDSDAKWNPPQPPDKSDDNTGAQITGSQITGSQAVEFAADVDNGCRVIDTFDASADQRGWRYHEHAVNVHSDFIYNTM
ncbi:MAG: hypothetical protein ABI557_14690 [Aureliella sp.]